jgi:hypothetical protein
MRRWIARSAGPALALALLAGCATPDPSLEPNARRGREAVATTPPGPAPQAPGTSDPGTRLLPEGPLGALAVETPPAEPAWERLAAPTPRPAPRPTRPSSTGPGDDLGTPPTGGLPPPALR